MSDTSKDNILGPVKHSEEFKYNSANEDGRARVLRVVYIDTLK